MATSWKLDTSHALVTSDLKQFLLPDEDTAGNMANLVSGASNWTTKSGASLTTQTDLPPILELRTLADYVASPTNEAESSDWAWAGSSGGSVAFWVAAGPVRQNSNAYLLSVGYGTGSDKHTHIQHQTDGNSEAYGNRLKIAVDDGSAFAGYPAPDSSDTTCPEHDNYDVWTLVVVTFDGTNTYRLYFDGTETESSPFTDGAAHQTSALDHEEVFIGNRSDNNSDRSSVLDFKAMAVWVGKTLTGTEVSNLGSSLYGMIDPDSDTLTATDLEVTTELDSPVLTQAHDLTATDLSVTTELDSATLGQAHALTATDLNATTELDSPVLTEQGADALTPNDLESATELDSPALTQVHALTATDLEALSKLDSPALSGPGTDALTADDLQALVNLDTPTIGQVHALTATDLEAITALDSPTLVDLGEITNAQLYTLLVEIHKILGLDATAPMTVTPASRTAGNISQTISGDGVTSTTVTRD